MLWYSVVLLCAVAARGTPTPATMPASYDTIIVGMGAAGCTAASTLAKAGKKVLGLEAMDRVGGRVNTVPFGDGVVELGAEWIHGQFPSRVYDLAIQNNVSIFPQDLTFDLYRSDGSTGDKEILNELMTFALGVVDDPPQAPEPLGQYITKRLMDYIQTNHPKLLGDKDFINEFLQFMDLIIDNYESSNSWNDVSTQSRYEELGGNQHLSWNRHGYKTLFEILLNTYNKGRGYPNLDIQLQKEVTQILWPQDPAEDVVVTCKDGASYRARNVIVTVSLGVLKERHTTLFSPVLPQHKISTIDVMSMGLLGKIILQFPQNWWGTSKNIVYTFVWYAKDKQGLEDDWCSKIAGVSVPTGADNVITIWTMGNVGKLTLFSPSLPQEKVTSIDKMSIGVVGKIILAFEPRWWQNVEWFPFLWRGEDRKKLSKDDAWLTNICGASPPLGSRNTLTFWTIGEPAKLVETLPEDVVKRKSMELIRRFMGKNRTIPEPVAMMRSSWFSNPYTRGSYTYDNVLTPLYPNARTTLGEPLVDSSGAPRVLFAGEATDPKHFSTVHGASDTGFREANRLLPQAKL